MKESSKGPNNQKIPRLVQKDRLVRTIVHTGVLTVALTTLVLRWASAASSDSPPKANAQSLQQWREARFGMFIHWGPVSLTKREISWSRANSNPKCPNNGPTPVAVYDNLYQRFNPTKFDARQWVAVAKAAGMKYMILTAKHCDGFLLWDSKVDDYNIMHTPFKRDVCGELAKAAHEAEMRIGWYFSPMDWRDPDFRTDRNATFVARMQGEVRELLTNYGQIDVLWFDWDGRKPMYDQATTYTLVRNLQPKIILTNRLDLGEGNNDRQILSPHADYYTPEQSVGAYDDQRPWESCMTISRSGQWAWGGPNDGVKTLAQCMNMLIRCAGGDGNMLLNVGPMPNGEIAPEQAVDGNSETRWATDSGTKSAWLEVDLGKPAAIGRCLIEQAYPELQRVRKFAIEYWQDGKWQTCYRGENLGATLEAAFSPVTAQRVRLNITEATDGPTIWEFELYPPTR